jgi:hypothetical protein
VKYKVAMTRQVTHHMKYKVAMTRQNVEELCHNVEIIDLYT